MNDNHHAGITYQNLQNASVPYHQHSHPQQHPLHHGSNGNNIHMSKCFISLFLAKTYSTSVYDSDCTINMREKLKFVDSNTWHHWNFLKTNIHPNIPQQGQRALRRFFYLAQSWAVVASYLLSHPLNFCLFPHRMKLISINRLTPVVLLRRVLSLITVYGSKKKYLQIFQHFLSPYQQANRKAPSGPSRRVTPPPSHPPARSLSTRPNTNSDWRTSSSERHSDSSSAKATPGLPWPASRGSARAARESFVLLPTRARADVSPSRWWTCISSRGGSCCSMKWLVVTVLVLLLGLFISSAIIYIVWNQSFFDWELYWFWSGWKR